MDNMDFTSAFLQNKNNYKDAYKDTTNNNSFINKIKNFILYSDVETAVCLGNKNLAGILWLGRLLERRDIEAKNSFIATDHNKTITNGHTNHAIDLHNDALPNVTQENTHIGQQDAIVAQHIIERQDNHNSVNAIEIQQLEAPATLPVQQAPSNNINKRKKRCQKSATTNEATSNDTHNTTLRAHTVTKMEDVIAIPSAVDSKPTFVNDLINLEGNLEHSGHDNAYTSVTHARHNAYLQELRSLAEDTIMTEANEECATPEWREPAPDPRHDIMRDYASPNCINHLDDLKITCDTKGQDNLHLAPDLINNPEKFFTPSHSFLPNVYNVDKDRDENEFETIKDDKGFWRTQKRPPKNPIKTLSTIKTDEKEKAKDNTSIHEKREDNFTTYDAYISLNDIDCYFHNDAKLAYVEMLARDLKGFAGSPCNYAINWIDRKARIAKRLPEIKPQENIVKLTQDDHSQHARITYEERGTKTDSPTPPKRNIKAKKTAQTRRPTGVESPSKGTQANSIPLRKPAKMGTSRSPYYPTPSTSTESSPKSNDGIMEGSVSLC
ncbi:hypothetical protein RclHR1_17370003 [Rhizophagus clarus]|uniref:Uncharacterized protein n=1 Tax=Rhizophagus clarus TaxID=94130 RepID=A0A2Z6QJY1_9GLOM|nr:hypothetical protein RclHR1_17370003 [Rhizophagus clarus]